MVVIVVIIVPPFLHSLLTKGKVKGLGCRASGLWGLRPTGLGKALDFCVLLGFKALDFRALRRAAPSP